MKTIDLNSDLKGLNITSKIEENYIIYTISRPYETAYGFGEKFDNVNQIGKKVIVSIRERCFYQEDYTYLTFPLMLTNEGFGLFVESRNYSEFDLTRKDVIEIKIEIENGVTPKLHIFEGSIKQILKDFKSIVGNSKLFPKWVYGAWISSNRWDHQAHIDEQIKMLDETKIPHSVMVIERWSDLTTFHHWYGSKYQLKTGDKYHKYDEFEFQQHAYYDPKQMIQELHDRNLKVLLWDLPMLATIKTVERPNPEQRLLDNEYIVENKLCVMKTNGEPYIIPHGNWFGGSMIPDFTNPKMIEYWFNHRKHLMEIGVDGFKTDGGEFVYEKDALFFDQTTGVSMKNGYADSYIKAYDKFIGKEKVIFSRAGNYEVANHTITWAGDQESTWQEFNSILKAGLSAGLSGITNWGYDIAGFAGYLPSKGLYSRSIQMGALTPIMQWHSEPITNGRCDATGAHKNNDRSPWNLATFHKDTNFLAEIKKQFNFHYNLIPYFYELALIASKEGTPALRHMIFEFNDKEVINLEKQYMLGHSLLVAPVLVDYTKTLNVYLPKETWYDLYTGEKYIGNGNTTINLKEDITPVFMKDNSCISLNLADDLKLGSYIGNQVDSYTNLTFILTGEGTHDFLDDLGNEISFKWNNEKIDITNNKLSTPLRFIRLDKLEENLWI